MTLPVLSGLKVLMMPAVCVAIARYNDPSRVERVESLLFLE
ncbi:hypothetical protein [Nostoc flagelliforme]